jgi:hypothetical protein
MMSFVLQPLYSQGKSLGTHLIGWGGGGLQNQSEHGGKEKKYPFLLGIEHWLLYCLSYPSSCMFLIQLLNICPLLDIPNNGSYVPKIPERPCCHI